MPTSATDWEAWLKEGQGQPAKPSSAPPVTRQETDWGAWLNEAPAQPTTSPVGRIMDAMDPQAALNAAAKARGQQMIGTADRPELVTQTTPAENPQSPQDWIKRGFALDPQNGTETPTGAATPLYYTDKAIAGEYGPSVQRAFQRASKALEGSRTQRFPWTELAAQTPPEERNDTLMAVAQLSAQKGEFRDKGTLAKTGLALKRGAESFKTAVDNTLGDLVGRVFGGKTAMAAGPEATSERLFEKAIQRAAESGDPLANPADPFWKRWTVQAAETTPAMAAGVATGGVAGMIAATFPITYDDSRDELLEAGVSPDAARVGGAISAAIQSVIEAEINLNPFAPKKARETAAKGVGEYLKRTFKAWTGEFSEEFMQGATQAATMAAATKLDESAPDLKLGDQLKEKMSDAMSAGGPLAVMMLPGFISGLPRSMRESVARRWMVNNPERAEKIAAKAASGAAQYSEGATVTTKDGKGGRLEVSVISRSDLPEIKSAAGRAEFAAEVAKQKPRYRYNNQTGKLEPVEPANNPQTTRKPENNPQIQPPPPGYGRPELANPGATQQARDAIDAIDQQRKEAGVPEVLPNAVVEQKAAELVASDYAGQMDRVLNGGEAPNPEVTAVTNLLFNTESVKALKGDADAILTANELGRAYRERRTDVARELQIGYDRVLTPEQRLSTVAQSAVELPEPKAAKVEKLLAPERSRTARIKQADIAIDDAWKRLGAAFGGNLGSNLGNLPEAAKAAGDLVVAYARKGIYKVEDIIADFEAKTGQSIGAKVRDHLKDAIKEKRIDLRAERIRTEAAKSEAAAKRMKRDRDKADKIIRQHAVTVSAFKNELKRRHGIDLDTSTGLTNEQAATALSVLKEYQSDTLAKVLEFRRNAMLSAPDTQVLNTTSNTAHAGYLFFGRYPVEAIIRKIMSPKDVNLGNEFAAMYRNLFSKANLMDALRTARKAFKLEVDVAELAGKERKITSQATGEEFTVSPVDVGGRGGSIKGRAGRVIRIPQRALLAADNFWKVIGQRTWVAMAATKIAGEEGYNPSAEPEAYDRRVQQLMADHGSPAWEEAEHRMREMVFQEPSAALNALNQWRGQGWGRLIQFLIPFTTTPWNVLRRALKVAPGTGTVALAFDIGSKNKTRIARGLADQAFGWLGFALLAAYNRPDDEEAPFRITGTKNLERRRRPLVSTSQSQPASMYLNGLRLGFSRFDPFATYFTTTVDAIQAYQEAKSLDEAGKVIGKYGQSIARSVHDKTWLQGASDLFEMIGQASEGQYGGAIENWASSFVVSFVPNTIRSVSRDIDPAMRDTHGLPMSDRIRMQAGFDTSSDQWAYDTWGEKRSLKEIQNSPMTDIPLRMLSPLRMDQQKPFIGTQVLMRWNTDHPDEAYWPGYPGEDYSDGKGKRVDMTPEQKAQFVRLAGQYAKSRVAVAKFSPIDKLTERDRDKIKDAIVDGRTKVRRALARYWNKGEQADEAVVRKRLRIGD